MTAHSERAAGGHQEGTTLFITWCSLLTRGSVYQTIRFRDAITKMLHPSPIHTRQWHMTQSLLRETKGNQQRRKRKNTKKKMDPDMFHSWVSSRERQHSWRLRHLGSPLERVAQPRCCEEIWWRGHVSTVCWSGCRLTTSPVSHACLSLCLNYYLCVWVCAHKTAMECVFVWVYTQCWNYCATPRDNKPKHILTHVTNSVRETS